MTVGTKKVIALVVGLVFSVLVVWFLEIVSGRFLDTPIHQSYNAWRRNLNKSLAQTDDSKSNFEIPSSFATRMSLPQQKDKFQRDFHNLAVDYTPSKVFEWLPAQGIRRPRKGIYRALSVHKLTKEVVYDVTYTFNSSHYRVTPDNEDHTHTRYAVFLGCSYTFGYGLNDDKTLPAQFQEQDKAYRSYNFAIAAYGPADLLVRIRSENFVADVKEESGWIIYNFLDSHVQRTVGTLFTLGYAGSSRPYFLINDKNELVQNGSFLNNRPNYTRASEILSRSNLARLLNFDWPFRLRKSDFQLTARVIDELRNEYLKKLPKAKFLVVIYPGSGPDRALLNEFENLGINYLNYGQMDLTRITREKTKLGYDSHPSAAALKVVAEQLHLDLKRSEL